MSKGEFIPAEGPVVRVLPDGKGFRLLEEFVYVDPNGRRWICPAESSELPFFCYNGSSIPWFFRRVAGTPMRGRHRFASFPHDRYYVVKSASPEDTHRMYYDACVTGGTSKLEAWVKWVFIVWANWLVSWFWAGLGKDEKSQRYWWEA